MDTFNNSEYKLLISSLLNDTQYIKISNMGKIAGLRKHAEVLVRKILNIGNNQKIMLGQIKNNSDNSAVKKGLNELGDDLSNELIKIIKIINPLGIDGTHTQHTADFSKQEVDSIEDAILDLYALLFIKYFTNIEISIYVEPQTLHIFSLLPPIIRYKTWNYLFNKDQNNIQVVNKLCLSIIKVFDKNIAYKWLEDNSKIIKAIPYPNADDIKKYKSINTFEIMPGLYRMSVSLDFDSYNNMYDLLYDKINDTRTSINEAGKMYKNFEEAIDYYNRVIIEYRNILDKDFLDLMEFVYIGRKSVEELK